MNSFSAMEWNAKWDWENLVMLSSKGIESPKKLEVTDWGILDDGEIDTGSFNLFGGNGSSSSNGWLGSSTKSSISGSTNSSSKGEMKTPNFKSSGGSGSNLGHSSPTKSSISASANSSSKEEMKTSNFSFGTFEGFPGDFSKKKELVGPELSGNSPPLDTSIGSSEPLIGLKLGKRTYFENNCAGSNNKTTSLSVIPLTSAVTEKKIRSSCQNAVPICCQVEGCNLDLSSAKDYHRKHRVCESHSKSPKVIVGGVERRFCQQCSRFHSLSDFDEKKRSCRRRLSDHNARRRKPQPAATQFNPARVSPPFYDGREKMNFVLDNAPLLHSRPATNSTWENTCRSNFTLTTGYPLKPEQKSGSIHDQPRLPGIHMPLDIGIPRRDSSRLMSFKDATTEVSSQGFKESTFPCTFDAAPDFRRALSLLSNSSCEPTAINHPMHVTSTSIPQQMVHAVPQALPLTPPEYWQAEQQSTHPLMHTIAANTNSGSHFQEVQILKTPLNSGFFPIF